MNKRIAQALAAIIAATALPLAFAQAPAPEAKPQYAYVEEPVASASLAQGPESERLNALVQALGAEASLKGSKITVAAEPEGGVLLTGVTISRAQQQKAIEIAKSQAGEGKVINAITMEELYVAPVEEQQTATVAPSPEPTQPTA